MAQLSEWLQLMLAEITQRQQQAEAAAAESAARPERPANEQGSACGPDSSTSSATPPPSPTNSLSLAHATAANPSTARRQRASAL